MPEAIAGQLSDADVLRLLEGQDRRISRPAAHAATATAPTCCSGWSSPAPRGAISAFLRERIFLPLGMDGAVAFVDGRSTVANRAYGYSLVDGRWTLRRPTTSATLGDGGIYASIDELAKWDAALRDGRLLSEASRTLASTAHTATDEADVDGYGYGWRLHATRHGPLLWHSGETSTAT